MSELIDREALLDECLNHYEVGNIEQNCTMDWICKTVRNFPAAPRWHRVEEPPKEHMWCFVYTDEPDMIMPIRIAFYVASCTGKGSWYHYESGEDIDDEVDYWTPMYLEGPDVDKDLPWPIEPPKEDA